MITKIENETEFDAFGQIDLYSIRIKSLLKAYGTGYDFAVFYKQTDDSQNITAILSKLDGNFTVSYLSGFADTEEISEFIHVIGYSSVLTDDAFSFDSEYDTGIVMVTNRKSEFHIPYAQLDEFPKLMDLFSLDDYSTSDFEAWYIDVNHRIRHSCAKAYSLNVNGEIISSAIFSSIYEENAILSSVKTQPEFRRMGYGQALVSEMIWDIKGNVFLMREINKNEEFYAKLGFINIGKWRIYK